MQKKELHVNVTVRTDLSTQKRLNMSEIFQHVSSTSHGYFTCMYIFGDMCARAFSSRMHACGLAENR